MRTCAIVNPVAGRGAAPRLWPRLEPALREVSSAFDDRWSNRPGNAETLTRDALRDGFERIVAVGGDGTLHEVVNGFFSEEGPVNPEAVLAVVPCGSGTDFRRALDLPIGVDAARTLESGRVEPIDVLHAEFKTENGDRADRYVVNIASFGLSGTVVRETSRTERTLPPRLHYLAAALRALIGTSPTPIELTLDGTSLGTVPLWVGAIANGHTFAAGLPIAPTATPRDGQLDITLLEGTSLFQLLRRVHRFYLGTHGTLSFVRSHRGQQVTAAPANKYQTVWLEGDGESLGRLPATIEVVPQAIRIQH